MEREFKNEDLNIVASNLKAAADVMKYTGDLSDFGNEVGFWLGKHYENMTEDEIELFITGFKHGISLTNGTH